jgi:hypothetical protein
LLRSPSLKEERMQRPDGIRWKRGLAWISILAGALAPSLMSPGVAYSLFVRENALAPDGTVRAVAYSNNTLYIGGSFSQVGPVSGPAVALDPVTAVAKTPYPRVTGYVRAVEPDGSGGWYIGGAFTAVQGQPRNNLAHIDAAGAVTSWNPDVNSEVDDIALAPGGVYIAGHFIAVGDSGRTFVAAVDAASGLATSWAPRIDNWVTEIEVSGNYIYIGGLFVAINGVGRSKLAAFNYPGGELTDILGACCYANVDALEFSDGKLFIAVTDAPFPLTYKLQVYDESSGFLPYFVQANSTIRDIAFDSLTGSIYLCGDFSSVGGCVSCPYLAAVDVATGSTTGWTFPVDGPVRTVAFRRFGGSPDALVIGGSFQTVGGVSRKYPAMVGISPAVTLSPPGCGGGEVYAVEFDGTKIYAGGDFSIINGVPRSNLAALDATGAVLLNWNPATNATVDALLVSGSTVYVGGQFSTVNGTTRNRAASVHAVTGALNAFNPNVDASPSTTVKTFAIAGTTLYMGGAFGGVRGVERFNLAAVNATTGAVILWNPAPDGPVNALTYLPGSILINPTLVAGGQFTFIGGQFRDNLATLDPTTGASGPLDSPNGPVHSLFIIPSPIGGFDTIFLGGAFSSVAGQPRNHLASLAAFGLVTSWDPNANGAVYSIALLGNTIIAGGDFTTIGTDSRNHIAAIDRFSGAATAWDPNATGGTPPGVVYALLPWPGTVYAGGSFTTIAGTPQSYFAGISDGTITGVEGDPIPAVTPLVLRVAPNPFERSTEAQFSLASGGETRVTVYDVAGRRIREIHKGWLPAGNHTIPWDGRDDSGRPAAAGVYFLGVETQTGHMGSKVYRVK